MEYQNLISAFGRIFGIKDLAPDENGLVKFNIDDSKIVISYDAKKESMKCVGVIGTSVASAIEKKTFDHEFLKPNTLNGESSQAIISRDPLDGNYVLILPMSTADLTVEIFIKKFGLYISALKKLKRKFNENL